jgi:hypothetical protein
LPTANDLAGVDQSGHHLSVNAKAKIALDACADNARKLAVRAFSRSSNGRLDKRRLGARIGIRFSATGKQAGHNGDHSCGARERGCGHLLSS